MKCGRCKKQYDCSIYQEWLNTRGVRCPFGDYQKDKKRRIEELVKSRPGVKIESVDI